MVNLSSLAQGDLPSAVIRALSTCDVGKACCQSRDICMIHDDPFIQPVVGFVSLVLLTEGCRSGSSDHRLTESQVGFLKRRLPREPPWRRLHTVRTQHGSRTRLSHAAFISLRLTYPVPSSLDDREFRRETKNINHRDYAGSRSDLGGWSAEDMWLGRKVGRDMMKHLGSSRRRPLYLLHGITDARAVADTMPVDGNGPGHGQIGEGRAMGKTMMVEQNPSSPSPSPFPSFPRSHFALLLCSIRASIRFPYPQSLIS